MAKEFYQLTDHVYYLDSKSSRRATLGVVIGNDQVLFVNAGSSVEHMNKMLQYFNDMNYHTDLPPLGVITDSHFKHVLGMDACGKMPFISHKLTKEKLDIMREWDWSDKELEKKVNSDEALLSDVKAIKKEIPEPRKVELPVPCIIYRHQLEVDLGSISCMLEHIESDSSDETTILHVQPDNVVFVGDALEPGYHGHTPFYTKKIFDLMDTLINYRADYYIVSKKNKIYDQNEFFEYCEYLRIVGATVSEYYNDFQSISEALGGILDKEDHNLISAFIEGMRLEHEK